MNSLSELVAGGVGQCVPVARFHMIDTADERLMEGAEDAAQRPCF